MLNVLPTIRPDERRPLILALVTLLTLMASHALLETARDTFFLAKLPATRLPWVYLAIAAASLIISWARQRKAQTGKRADLMSFLLLAALVNLAFMFSVDRLGEWTLYALYVWSGVFSTLAVVQFWNMVNTAFTVVQAKRLFAFIGVGGVVGAIVGSALAGGITTLFSTRLLLLAGAAAAVAAAAAARMLSRSVADADEGEAPQGIADTGSIWDPLKQVKASPYLIRLGLVVWLSAFGLTLVDFVFKDIVANNVPVDQLGRFFSATYLGLNVLSLIVQLFVVNWLMRSVGVSPLLAVLPVLASFGVVAVALGGGVLAALAMKGADGMLRHSLHRTVVEVLYVPLNAGTRARVKELLDVIGQRGGQAMASVFILVLAAIDAESYVVFIALVALVAWVLVSLELRPHYLDLFRRRIETSALTSRMALPSLDLASLEALMGALNSQSDDEVIAAMDLLHEQERSNLIPALILYHPSAQVVRRALRIFSATERADFLPIADRLVGHVDPEVRAGVLRVRTAKLDDERPLREALGDPATIVRATAVAGLAAAKGCGDEDVAMTLDELLSRGTAEGRLALARAIGDRPDPVCAWILVKLGEDADDRVRLEAARAMRVLPPDNEYVGSLVRMLDRRALRTEARTSLVALGDAALPALKEAMANPTLTHTVRLHLPRTVCRFAPQAAADILMEHLPQESDGSIRFKILRGLGVLKSRDPDVRFSPDALSAETTATLDEACRLLFMRVQIRQGVDREPAKSSDALSLLMSILKERERYAVDRLFRLLHLQDQRDDFAHIRRGLRSNHVRVQASSRELLENRLVPELRATTLALVDDIADDQRVAGLAPHYSPPTRSLDEVVRLLLIEGGVMMKLLALHYVGEKGRVTFREAVEACLPNGDREVEVVRDRTLSLLSGRYVSPEGSGA